MRDKPNSIIEDSGIMRSTQPSCIKKYDENETDPQASRRYPFKTSEKPKYLSVSGVTENIINIKIKTCGSST